MHVVSGKAFADTLTPVSPSLAGHAHRTPPGPGPRAWGTWWRRTAGPPEAASRREMRIRRQRDELTAPRVRRLLNGVEREVSSLSWDPVIAPKLLSNPVNDPEGLGNTPVKPVNAWKLEESPDQLTTDSKPHFLKLFRWLTTETNLKSYI